MRIGVLTDLAGQEVGKIIEEDSGELSGEGKGISLLEQAPLKTFDDWVTHLHHSTYLRIEEQA